MTKYSVFKRIQLIIVGCVLFVVCISSIQLAFDGYYSFYYEQEDYKEALLSKATRSIYNATPFKIFAYYTGFDTGYGFFAPNVASSFLFVFKFYDRKGKLEHIIDHVPFQAKESSVRFRSINGIYFAKLKDSAQRGYDSKYNRYLDIILKQLSKYVKKTYLIESFKTETNLYLFDYPTIQAFREGAKEKALLIKSL